MKIRHISGTKYFDPTIKCKVLFETVTIKYGDKYLSILAVSQTLGFAGKSEDLQELIM
jgi:hypothetical protein